MNIVNASSQFLQTVKPVFPRKVQGLLTFGYQALSLQRIQSINSNARSINTNRKTAESRAYRLSKSKLLRQAFAKVAAHLELVNNGDNVSVDFSDFGIVQVLMFAKRTDKGRALPIWFKVLPYGWTKETSQNTFVNQAIGEFLVAINNVNVTLVFDRGFAAPTIIEYLCANNIMFVLRIKADKRILGRKGGTKAKFLTTGLHPVWVYGNRLNLVITPKPAKDSQPWYLLTNDLSLTAETVTEIYYHRFEIEEVFKDTKHLFGLETIQFKLPERLTTVVWFVTLGFWLHDYLDRVITDSRIVVQKAKQLPVQGRTHYWLEQIKHALQAEALKAIAQGTC
jgi:Transposase DDE domain